MTCNTDSADSTVELNRCAGLEERFYWTGGSVWIRLNRTDRGDVDFLAAPGEPMGYRRVLSTTADGGQALDAHRQGVRKPAPWLKRQSSPEFAPAPRATNRHRSMQQSALAPTLTVRSPRAGTAAHPSVLASPTGRQYNPLYIKEPLPQRLRARWGGLVQQTFIRHARQR
jgi:hypothetical protein